MAFAFIVSRIFARTRTGFAPAEIRMIFGLLTVFRVSLGVIFSWHFFLLSMA